MQSFSNYSKHFHKALLVFMLVFGIHGAVAAQKVTDAKSVYVIVHGAWGGSWAFKAIDSILTKQGHVVYRPSLTGQGERVHLSSPEVGLSTHINDVVNTILFEKLSNVILVGHSYGGMVITGVADRVPERIKRLIYLDAFLPNDGESLSTIQSPQGRDWIYSMVKDGFIVPSWIKEGQPVPKDVPQSLKTFTEPISLTNTSAKKLPAMYILTVDPGKKPESDTFYPSYLRAKERGWTMLEMSADHNPQWSAPVELANLLLKGK